MHALRHGLIGIDITRLHSWIHLRGKEGKHNQVNSLFNLKDNTRLSCISICVGLRNSRASLTRPDLIHRLKNIAESLTPTLKV